MPQSAFDKALVERIENDFMHHPPKSDQADRYAMLRTEAKGLALKIANLCPDGRERSLALTNLEQCVMWANAAIARAN